MRLGLVKRSIATLCLGALSVASLISPARGIIGGAPDTISNSFVVKIFGPAGSCSGTLIARTWVLTAAHCLWDSISGTYYGGLSQGIVATADGIAGRSSAFSKVLGAVVHPDYTHYSIGADIGLIQVNDVFGGVYADLATADDVKVVEDTFSIGIASGFGKTSQSGSGTISPLEIGLRLLAQNYCRTNWPYSISYNFAFVCVESSTTAATCQGDSGGPLFVTVGGTRKVAGVTSFGGAPCGASYSVFTRVSSYLSFLQSYGIGAPEVIIPQLPTLPALPPPSVVVVAPTLPGLPGTPSAPLPKFITTRIFQLVLEDVGSNRCLWDIDGPQTLRGYRVSIFLKKQSTKPTFQRILDEFGDATGMLKLSCRSVRLAGVFISTESSGVRMKVPE